MPIKTQNKNIPWLKVPAIKKPKMGKRQTMANAEKPAL